MIEDMRDYSCITNVIHEIVLSRLMAATASAAGGHCGTLDTLRQPAVRKPDGQDTYERSRLYFESLGKGGVCGNDRPTPLTHIDTPTAATSSAYLARTALSLVAEKDDRLG